MSFEKDLSPADSLDVEGLNDGMNDSDRLLSGHVHPQRKCMGWMRRALPWALHIAVDLLFIAIFWTHSSLARTCIDKNRAWSPANKLLHAESEVWRFNGSFTGNSPYRGPMTPEVDEAWSKLWNVGELRITEHEFARLNASPHAVKVPESLGGGRLALLEATHQIHCVHALWQQTYPEFYKEEHQYSLEHPEQWHKHMDHCADVLRQKLMCDADTSIITFNWLSKHFAPHPNFNVEHKCRNFEDVHAFALERRLDYSPLGRNYLTRPEDGSWVEFEGEPPYHPWEKGVSVP